MKMLVNSSLKLQNGGGFAQNSTCTSLRIFGAGNRIRHRNGACDGPSQNRLHRHGFRMSALSSGEEPLVGSDFLKGPTNLFTQGVKEEEEKIEDVELISAAGMDYSELRDCLKEEKFQKADDITRAAIIELAGPDAKSRGWVYFTEVQFLPEEDLKTIDKLWSVSSNKKFGYLAQRRIFLQNRKLWTDFFVAIDWVTGENNNYRKWPQGFNYEKSAKAGHLPLTNCLRGTQLFEGIMMHPAFGGPREIR